MKRARLLAFLLIPLTAGCDIAVVAVLATRKGGSKNSSPPAPDPSYFVWVADLTGVIDATEANDINTAGGVPTPKWTLLTSATSSGEFTMPAGNFNGVLVQVTQAQAYELDAFEVLDATGTTIAVPGAVFADAVTVPGPATGAPNGVTTTLTGTSTNNAFVFMHHSAFITTFRVNIWKPLSRGGGDLEWTATYGLGGNQTAGGADVNSAGMTYLTMKDGNSVFLLRYNSSGVVVQDDNTIASDLSSIASSVSATVGSSSVAIDRSTDDVFIASTVGAGDIRLQKWVGNHFAAAWGGDVVSSAGVDRVEANGLALDSNGDLILAGGFDTQGVSKVQPYIKKFSKSGPSDLWTGSPPPAYLADINDNYWYGVATTGTNSIIATGNMSPTLGLGTINIQTQRLLDNSPTSVTETWADNVPDAGNSLGIGRSVGVDSAGNIYVAGSYTHTDLDGIILKYTSGAPPASVHVRSTRVGNDEILDIVVEPDGTIYAVGYETNANEDLVLMKILPNNSIAWKRTFDRGVGNDRGVSVCTTATRVIVVGEVTVGAGNKDIHVRSYVK